MEWIRGSYVVSDDKSRLKIPQVATLLRQSYWAKDHSPEKIQRMIENSFCLGLSGNGELMGFARVVTDKVTFAWITDFIIDEKHQREGWGSWLMGCLLEHPDLLDISKGLGTQNADAFFEKFGFCRSGNVLVM